MVGMYDAHMLRPVRLRILHGGPGAGTAGALATLGVSVVLLGPLLRFVGVDSIVSEYNDHAIAINIDNALIVSLLAAGFGAWAGIHPSDRGTGHVSVRSVMGILAGALVTAVTVPTGIAALIQGPHTISLATIVVMVELAVAGGTAMGLCALRWPEAAATWGAALAAFWFDLTACGFLIRAIAPAPERSFGPSGDFTAAAQWAINVLHMWAPVVTGVAAAAGVVLASLLAGLRRPIWLTATAAAPLLLRLIGTGLSVAAAGTEAMDTSTRVWIHLTVGCLAGYGLSILITRSRRGS